MEYTAKDEVFDACLLGCINHREAHGFFLRVDRRTIVEDNRNASECRFELLSLEVICHNNRVRRRPELGREGLLYVGIRTSDDTDRWAVR